ncbi:MAG: DUF11 domain-containing protein, partial [Methanobrevibacter sp.]|nr:DUF11 domain-containing protein [Candidatus Methanoflexus mossambicus]
AVIGDVVEYNISVVNNGGHSGDYNVTDYFNGQDLVYKDYSVVYGGNASGIVFDSLSRTWTVNDLVAGSSVVFVVRFMVNATGIVTNNVNVTSFGNDTNFTNETNITVNGSENITVVKVANVTNISNVGWHDIVTYVITVVNNGGHSGDYNVTDYFNGCDLVYVNDSAVVFENSGDAMVVFDVDALTWTINDLGAGEFVTLHINFIINATGNVTNYVNVSSFGNDTNTSNETNITVNKTVNVTIVETANVTSVFTGEYVLLTVNVTNNGPDNATHLDVRQIISPLFEYISSDDDEDVLPQSGGSGYSWLLDHLDVGESKIIHILIRAVGPAGDALDNVTVDTEEFNIGDNEDNNTIRVLPTINISIVKVANVTGANIGDNILFTVTIVNNGPDIARNLTVTDILNKAFKYINSTISIGNVKVDKQTLCWTIPDLGVGIENAQTWNIRVKVTGGSGKVYNTVEVSSNEDNEGNSLSNVSVVVNSKTKVKSKLDLKVEFTPHRYKYHYTYEDEYINGYYVRHYKGYNIGKETIGQINFCLGLYKWITHGHFVTAFGDSNIISHMSKNQKRFYISVLNAKPYKTTGIMQHFTFIYKFNDNKPVVSGGEYTTIKVNTQKMSATLKDIHGKALKGKTIKFYADKKYIGSAKTNSKGIATKYYSIFNGYTKLVAKFDGDNVYYGSTDSHLPVIKLNNYTYSYKDIKPKNGNKLYIREYTGKNMGQYPITANGILRLNKYKNLISSIELYSSKDVIAKYNNKNSYIHIQILMALPYNVFKAVQKLRIVVKLK